MTRQQHGDLAVITFYLFVTALTATYQPDITLFPLGMAVEHVLVSLTRGRT